MGWKGGNQARACTQDTGKEKKDSLAAAAVILKRITCCVFFFRFLSFLLFADHVQQRRQQGTPHQRKWRSSFQVRCYQSRCQTWQGNRLRVRWPARCHCYGRFIDTLAISKGLSLMCVFYCIRCLDSPLWWCTWQVPCCFMKATFITLMLWLLTRSRNGSGARLLARWFLLWLPLSRLPRSTWATLSFLLSLHTSCLVLLWKVSLSLRWRASV